MIYGIFHPGSGLGNQLHRYVATRILAKKKDCDFSIINANGFKGSSFIKLNVGVPSDMDFSIEEPSGKIIPYTPLKQWNEWNKQVFDPDFNFIEDHTIIDGNFEDPKYFEEYLPQINEWLETEPLNIPDDVCVIGFRGGEYYAVPELGLPKEYYHRATDIVKNKYGITKFEVHTDDPELAKQFFPNFRIIKNISDNWRAMRYAKYAIIANSSFYVLPRLLNGGLTIAPRYWNRYNIKKWDYPQNYYKQFTWI